MALSADPMNASRPTLPSSLFGLKNLLSENHPDYNRSRPCPMSDDVNSHAASAAQHHLFLLVDRIKQLSERQTTRWNNPQWNDRRHYDRLLKESPVGYVIHERLEGFTIDDVLYRFDIIQLDDAIALRVIQDTAGTIKQRKKKYFERYEGLAAVDQQKEMDDLLRDLLGNLREDLKRDIADALEKATAPKPKAAQDENFSTNEEPMRIASFYDSVFFMGMLSQACTTRLDYNLGLLMFI